MKHLALLLAGAAALAVTATPVRAVSDDLGTTNVKRVLLISIDGMHAVDFQNCVHGIYTANGGAPYCPALAALGQTGINYVAGSTSRPSDSFPGLMSIVSGATPRTLGVYYDVAYDRSLDAPAKTTGNGVAAGPCTAGAAPTGTRTEYEEGIDLDQTKLNGGAPGASLTDGGVASIDTTRLPRDPKAGCAPVLPWNFVRLNTIFSVIHSAGGYTAWSDKHPAYSAVAGTAGIGNLDDFFGPEINSLVVPVPGITTPAGVSCATVPDPSQLGSWTDSFANIQCYDTIKADAILNEIQGKDHTGAKTTHIPTIFGMNFQAVSVGQKLIEANVGTGGYLDAMGTPSELLIQEIQFVDASIGKMVTELKDTGNYDNTMIVITAKHGQGPIDRHRFNPIPGHSGNNGITPATVLANYLPYSESPLNPTGIGATEDDVSILWLQDSRNTGAAIATLEANQKAIGLGTMFYGPSLALNYNAPGLPPNGDPRSPDIIVTPNPGVIYTGSKAKQAEHGGFSHDDTNVMILVSNPSFHPLTVYSDVSTSQVAPSILKELGLDPTTLQGVQLEGTPVLPGLN